MAQTPQQDLDNLKSELRSIIYELTRISDDLEQNRGIGVEKCSTSLNSVAREYRNFLSKLERISFESNVYEGKGGSSGGGGSSRSF